MSMEQRREKGVEESERGMDGWIFELHLGSLRAKDDKLARASAGS